MKFTAVALQADIHRREKKLRAVRNYCAPTVTHFWHCFNSTLSEIEKGDSWFGRRCCTVPHSVQCQHSCLKAAHKEQLMVGCRKSDELAFYSCLDKQEVADDCCSEAKSPECLDSCKEALFSGLTPRKEHREAVKIHCTVSSPKVAHCVRNLTKLTTTSDLHKYLNCCDKSSNEECQNTCKISLQSNRAFQEIIDNLQEGGCGVPLPHDDLWQCFLRGGIAPDSNVISRIDQIGMDSAKLHCCHHAVSAMCRRLCLKTYSDEWMRSWSEFDKICLTSLNEDRLQSCIDEVDEPCELGCDGLNYCSNFNGRPNELFRSCTVAADEAARHDVSLWSQQGFLRLPGGLDLPLKNLSRCHPQSWKAVACALQVKPCHSDSHTNRICLEDCYSMLAECIDWSRMPPGQTVSSICALMSPSDKNRPCVSLRNFMESGDFSHIMGNHITTPCRGSPCDNNELCTINRNCRRGRPCQNYQCLPGCRLGEASWFVVASGTYVRIPTNSHHSSHKGCIKICQCNEFGVIDKCQPLPCVPSDDCWLGERKIAHGSTFKTDCNTCTCYAGEVTCNRRQCDSSASLPCNCPQHYVPVCGTNAATYPNACLAKCAGLRDGDYEFGACSTKNTCESQPCSEGEVCVPTRRVCLSHLEKSCVQYKCVDPGTPCSEQSRSPVCDTLQQEHPNICYLARAGRNFSYYGSCRGDCRTDSPVCGSDGETYPSECSALAFHRTVDYPGPCITVGLVTEEAKPICGPIIKCPRLPAGCLGATPPGACCPICAGALRILYSKKQVDRALYALHKAPTDALTEHEVLKALERQVQTSECEVRGFLTVELDIFVAVVPQDDSSEIQRTVCIREAEKLSNLIRTLSPRFQSQLSLSILTTSWTIHKPIKSAARARWSLNTRFMIILIALQIISSWPNNLWLSF